MRGKKTKGKQKINIKRIEKNEDRLVTFSKRRTGIHTKLSEISVLCGADVGFLVNSGTGKPYTFGNPSFESVAERFLNGDRQEINGEGSSSIIDAHKKVRMEELCKKYNDLVEKVDAEEEKAVTVATKTALPVENDAWWNVDPKGEEETRQFLAKFEAIYENLCEVVARRSHDGNGASTSQVKNN